MDRIPGWGFLLFLLVGFYFNARAARHIKPGVQQPLVEWNFRRGLIGGKDLLTQEGLMYRRRALQAYVAAALAGVAWIVMSAFGLA